MDLAGYFDINVAEGYGYI